MMEIRSKARRLKSKEPNLGLIIVDYLQLMTSGSTVGNRVQEVSQISRNLKVLARDLDVPVIALSQLSRAVEQRHDKRPILSDLRESGSSSRTPTSSSSSTATSTTTTRPRRRDCGSPPRQAQERANGHREARLAEPIRKIRRPRASGRDADRRADGSAAAGRPGSRPCARRVWRSSSPRLLDESWMGASLSGSLELEHDHGWSDLCARPSRPGRSRRPLRGTRPTLGRETAASRHIGRLRRRASDRNCRRSVGEGQGQDRRPAGAALRCRVPLPGRAERRAHRSSPTARRTSSGTCPPGSSGARNACSGRAA